MLKLIPRTSKVNKLIVEIGKSFFRDNRWAFIRLYGTVLTSSILAVATPYFVSRLLDRISLEELPTYIIYGFIGYSALFALTFTMQRVQSWLAQSLENSVNFLTSTILMQYVMRKSSDFFLETGPTEIQATIQQSQTGARALFNLLTLVVSPSLVQFIAAVALLGAALRVEVAIIVFIYGIFFIAFTYYLTKKASPFLDSANESFRQNAKQVGHIVLLMETLRYYNAQSWFIGKYTDKAQETRQAWEDWAKLHARSSIVFGLAVFAQFSINYILIIPSFTAGEVTIGGIILFNALLIQLNTPFGLLGTAINRSSQAYTMLAFGAKVAFASEEYGISTSLLPSQIQNTSSITFLNVGFSYRSEERTSHILNNVSFEIDKKRINFITGPSGSGKSTILKLMLKNIQPSTGKIVAGDINLTNIEAQDWYSLIGVVPQDIVLMGDTIEDNILLGRSATENEMQSAIERAAIADLIRNLPLGLKTVVGERGLKLSGGERQRIGIARALLKNPLILLLDEASSALDETTERSIVEELRKLKDLVIVVAVTHRESVLKADDHAIRLTKGKAVTEIVKSTQLTTNF